MKWMPGREKYGIEVRCPHHGGTCRKSCLIDQDMDVFGKRACEYFLGAWIMNPNPADGQPHGRWRLKRADVRNYMNTYGEGASG